jgi:hypothetical protein
MRNAKTGDEERQSRNKQPILRESEPPESAVETIGPPGRPPKTPRNGGNFPADSRSGSANPGDADRVAEGAGSSERVSAGSGTRDWFAAQTVPGVLQRTGLWWGQSGANPSLAQGPCRTGKIQGTSSCSGALPWLTSLGKPPATRSSLVDSLDREQGMSYPRTAIVSARSVKSIASAKRELDWRRPGSRSTASSPSCRLRSPSSRPAARPAWVGRIPESN